MMTALALCLVVIAQTAISFRAGYIAAPEEIVTFIDAVDFSIQENESYDRDVAKVQRLEDKIRLNKLLRDIQKGGDDLREDLNNLIVAEGTTALRTSTRLLWASKRTRLEERLRRLDMLRMRFLVVYLGIITSIADKQPPPPPPLPREPEKMSAFTTPIKPALHKAFTDSIVKRPPLRQLSTPHAVGHNAHNSPPHRQGWAGVVEELQTSPRMQQRHASIEQAMARASP